MKNLTKTQKLIFGAMLAVIVLLACTTCFFAFMTFDRTIRVNELLGGSDMYRMMQDYNRPERR